MNEIDYSPNDEFFRKELLKERGGAVYGGP